MQLLIVASVCLTAAIHIASAPCPPEAANFDFKSKYCQADVVFSGTPISGKVHINMGTNGTEIISVSEIYQVDKYFKDNSGRQLTTVTINQTYNRNISCEFKHLHVMHDSHLIFAAGNDGLVIPECGGIILGACVPDSVTQALLLHKC